MSGQQPKHILVGVGHDPIGAALQFAAHDALRAECDLHLLHVVHEFAQGPEALLIEGVDLERAGRLALDGAAEKARDLLGADLKVTTELVWGSVVGSIVNAASSARTVVLERRTLTRLERVVTRSISAAVAARARVPVISVPARWSPVRSTGHPATVTVGVDIPERSRELLRVAVGEARARDAQLRILHTWYLPGAYADLVMPPAEADRWSARASAEIHDVLDGLGDDEPLGEVIVDARHAYPGHALVELARTSDLLIVGRHDPLVPFGSHLGPVARAVLREATCPVLLADPGPPQHRNGRASREQVG